MATMIDSEFKLYYDVPEHEIDSQTLIESLIGITNLIQEANKQLDPSKRINVRVKALGTGSFVVHVELIEASIIDAIRNIFSPEAINYAASLVTIAGFVLAYVTIRKHNKEPYIHDEGETLTVESPDGNMITIDKDVYEIAVSSPVLLEAGERTLTALSNNEEVNGFQILRRDDTPIFEIRRDALLAFAAALAQQDEEIPSRIVTRTMTMAIVKPSFERRYKWDFAYLGVRISASIRDNAFLDRVERGEEQFASGDALECEVQIGEEYDQKSLSYIGRGYEVIRVIRHIPKTNPQLSIEP